MTTANKGGAPRGNLNAARNGGRMYRMTVGELPKEMWRIKSTVRRYRRDLEQAVIERCGEVSVAMAHTIDLAVASEQHNMVCRWLLNQKLDGMSVSDIVTCSREMMRAKETRNRAVRELQLDVDREADVIATLYSSEAAMEERLGLAADESDEGDNGQDSGGEKRTQDNEQGQLEG